MSPFGPFYPRRLQRSVNHADLLASYLARAEGRSRGGAGLPDIWLIGRAGEVARVVETVVMDWRSGARLEETAARALEDYLDFLHEGIAIHLGVSAPPCCAGLEETRVPPAREPAPEPDTVDRLLRDLERSAAPPAGTEP